MLVIIDFKGIAHSKLQEIFLKGNPIMSINLAALKERKFLSKCLDIKQLKQTNWTITKNIKRITTCVGKQLDIYVLMHDI